ncbi:hypothetical protein EGY31_21095 [Burkholderia multivorans]|uniref:hypothetical protein n=1 Tax=Burkholderia ubonensis TaxID=101571 RepID=UPI000F6CC7FF|nr:hypothetical protein [Burkholderia ubonensis]AYZ65765.1 hypothetical protein EGY31_21095 [Burkholderia multivorans]VWC26040.1 hypothetical protein BUB20358_06094 [Burkholderia ubonensis]
MSRWLNSPVAIGVGAREVVVGARTRGRWYLRKRAPVAEPVSVAIPDAQFGTEPGVLDALRAALGAAQQGAEPSAAPMIRSAYVVLDDFWCNHAILRGDFRTLRARELEAVALAHFSDTCGIDGDALVVRWCVQHGGRALFASALPRALHDGMHEACAASAMRIRSVRACLPQMLNRIAAGCDGDALLLFVAGELMQAVMIERVGWAAYDAQRLFAGDAGDASRLAELAGQLFERSATRAGLKREECRIYLCGIDMDPAPFAERFAAAIRPPQPALDGSLARRLMEAAQ